MQKKYKVLIFIAFLFIYISSIVLIIKKNSDIENITFGTPHKTEGLTIVPTMQDEITSDSLWTATFQLVWNDLMKEVAKTDIIFTPQELMAKNLNKQEFTVDMISDSYYYKNYGLKTLELKAEIEKGIKEKFDQESDILDLFDWSEEELNNPENPYIDRYFFYVMLYRKFEYLTEFDKLENDTFGEYKGIKYFGINDKTKEEVGNQIEVLYYNSEEDFAILINTKTNDEVIYNKNPKGKTFKEIYDNMNYEINRFNGDTAFNDVDYFKAPNLKFNELREYDELSNKPFPTEKGSGEIVKALQTIQFYLDEKGGEVKSEAGIDARNFSAAPNQNQPRYFRVDNTFAIFLREKGKKTPYFAGRIDDITKFQK